MQKAGLEKTRSFQYQPTTFVLNPLYVASDVHVFVWELVSIISGRKRRRTDEKGAIDGCMAVEIKKVGWGRIGKQEGEHESIIGEHEGKERSVAKFYGVLTIHPISRDHTRLCTDEN